MEGDDILAVAKENVMHMRSEQPLHSVTLKGLLPRDVIRRKEFCDVKVFPSASEEEGNDGREASKVRKTREKKEIFFDKEAASDDARNSRTATTTEPAERK